MSEPERQPDEREPAPPQKSWRRLVALRLLAVVVAVFAAILVTLFSVDLGPSLRGRAEAGATKYLERPMHIGKLTAKLRPGEFELHDVVIEGLTPESKPFLKAKLITVKFPWWI